MVGSALYRKLSKNANIKIIIRSRDDLNLINQKAVDKFFEENSIDQVYLAAAKVGSIYANKLIQLSLFRESDD